MYSCMFTCIQLSLCPWTRDINFQTQGCHAAWSVQVDSRKYDPG